MQPQMPNSSTQHQRKPVIFLMGPTAAGKTAAAMHLADHLDCKLISVDSALIFRTMDIGTAKPSKQELAQYPHELIDVRNPQDSYSAAEFKRDATAQIDLAHQQNQIPVLVGGTMLYFKALLQGLAALPSADEKTRLTIQTFTLENGIEHTHQWLATVDPISAERLHHNDQQRIERALEIYLMTGQPMSALYKPEYFQKGWDTLSLQESPWHILPIAIAPPEKKQLHPFIEKRFDLMLELGFLDEMQTLMTQPDIHRDLPSMRCVGYRQAWAHLRGESTFNEFLDQGKAATRQLAKRQMTWLRSWSELHWVDPFQQNHRQCLLQLIQQHIEISS